MGKRVVIVGGTGNISQSITDLLLKKGYDVTLFNRGQSAAPNGVRVICGDRHDRNQFISVMQKEKFDYAIDMIGFCLQDAQDDYMAFRETERFVFCSSGAVYGVLSPHYTPIPEDAPRNPTWDYGVGKKAAEDYFLYKRDTENFSVTILRPTFTYGRQKVTFRQFLNDNSWIDRIKKGKPIVTGNPYLLRNFLHVDDAAIAFVGALEHAVCRGQVYNMVSLRPYNWEQYHLAMMDAVGRRVEMIEVPYDTLASYHLDGFVSFQENWRYNGYYSGEKIARDIPEFGMTIPIEEGVKKMLCFLEEGGYIPNSDAPEFAWEDEMIRNQLATQKR
jgi:nucleoside-diphosphate-sugar epimerase